MAAGIGKALTGDRDLAVEAAEEFLGVVAREAKQSGVPHEILHVRAAHAHEAILGCVNPTLGACCSRTSGGAGVPVNGAGHLAFRKVAHRRVGQTRRAHHLLRCSMAVALGGRAVDSGCLGTGRPAPGRFR